jgi:hypothetical protein
MAEEVVGAYDAEAKIDAHDVCRHYNDEIPVSGHPTLNASALGFVNFSKSVEQSSVSSAYEHQKAPFVCIIISPS